jgi:uncharacterized membrane protein
MQNNSRAFNTDIATFTSKTRIRVLKEVLVFVVLAALLFSPIAKDLPILARYIFLLLVLIYILIGVINYPKAKSIAESMKIVLAENQMEILGLNQKHCYPYKDINVVKIKKSKGMVTSILLNIEHVGKQWISGFENMDIIYKLLQSRLKQ